jgi:hypothetical protein
MKKILFLLIVFTGLTSCKTESNNFQIVFEHDNLREGYLNVYMEYKTDKIKIDEFEVYNKKQITPNNDFTISTLPSTEYSNLSDEEIIYACTYSQDNANWEYYGRDDVDNSAFSKTYYVINNGNRYTIKYNAFAQFEGGGHARDFDVETFIYFPK